MNVWKIGSRWGEGGISVLHIFRKYNIVFVGEAAESINSVKIGDLIAVTDGIKVVSVGIIASKRKPITEFKFDIQDIETKNFNYDDLVDAFKVLLFDLKDEDCFDYSRGKFHKVHGEHESKIIKLINDCLTTKNNFTTEEKPYALKQIQVINYRGIKNIHIQNIPTDTQWIFLTGENGFGKTSILQGIVIGLYNNTENIRLDKHEEMISIVEFKSKKENIINILSDNSFENFAAYGAYRTKLHPTGDEINKTDNLFGNSDYVLDFESKYKSWRIFPDKNKVKIQNFEKLLQKIIPNLSRIDIDSETSKVIYFEKTENGEEFNPVYFNQLALGMRNIIAMICDFIFRISENKFDIIFENDKMNVAGIVIIDEFDNHLHPKWQRLLVEKLTDIFPKVQFIVSTHSEIPMLGAPRNSVILKINRTKEDGVMVEKLDIDISELPPENILSSPIFDFQDVIPKSHQKGQRLRTEKGYNEVEFQKILEQKLLNLAKEGGFENDLK